MEMEELKLHIQFCKNMFKINLKLPILPFNVRLTEQLNFLQLLSETDLSLLCSDIEEKLGAKFEIYGFNLHWPVDVSYDFLAFITELKSSLDELKCEKCFRIELYEQGIERVLSFKAWSNNYEISCTELISGKVVGDKESVLISDLKEMFNDVIEQLLTAKIYLGYLPD